MMLLPKVERHQIKNPKNNQITENPSPPPECCNSDASEAVFGCLGALGVGPGFLLRRSYCGAWKGISYGCS